MCWKDGFENGPGSLDNVQGIMGKKQEAENLQLGEHWPFQPRG